MSKYQINKNFIIQKNSEEIIVFNIETLESYTLNSTASRVFNYLEEGWSNEEIKRNFLSIYPDVKGQDIKRDIDQIINYLLKMRIIVSS